MKIDPPLPITGGGRPTGAAPRSRLYAVSRWIAVASAFVALLTQVVQLLAMAWRELPRP